MLKLKKYLDAAIVSCVVGSSGTFGAEIGTITFVVTRQNMSCDVLETLHAFFGAGQREAFGDVLAAVVAAVLLLPPPPLLRIKLVFAMLHSAVTIVIRQSIVSRVDVG